jgi:xylulokinase
MSWYRNNFGRRDEEEAERSNRNVWEVIYSRAGESPPGNRGVVVLPFFQGANGPFWNLNARGMVLGLHTEHGSAHLIRGLIEGLAYESRRQMELMQEGGATVVRQVKMYGGSARSHCWNQIFADVLNRELCVTESEETTALGAAISAGVGCGIFNDFQNAVESMVSVKSRYRPVHHNAERYEKYYRRVYLDLYERVQQSMQRIADINEEYDYGTEG